MAVAPYLVLCALGVLWVNHAGWFGALAMARSVGRGGAAGKEKGGKSAVAARLAMADKRMNCRGRRLVGLGYER